MGSIIIAIFSLLKMKWRLLLLSKNCRLFAETAANMRKSLKSLLLCTVKLEPCNLNTRGTKNFCLGHVTYTGSFRKKGWDRPSRYRRVREYRGFHDVLGSFPFGGFLFFTHLHLLGLDGATCLPTKQEACGALVRYTRTYRGGGISASFSVFYDAKLSK